MPEFTPQGSELTRGAVLGWATWWHLGLNGYLTPNDVRPYLNELVWWLCPNGHTTQDTLSARSRRRVCQKCLGARPRRSGQHENPRSQVRSGGGNNRHD